MKKVIDRRVSLDESGIEIMNRLSNENPFKGLSRSDLFAIAMIQGVKEGIRTPISSRTGIVRLETLENNDLKYLMMATAIKDSGNMEIITNKNDYFKICEEYARFGLNVLESKFLDNPKNLLEELEFEALEFFDEYIE